MWIDDAPVQRNWEGGSIRISDVLYEFDSPVVFRAQVGFNDFLFAKRDETDDFDYFIAVETDDNTVKALQEGRLSLRGALYKDEGWLIESQSLAVTGFQYISEVHLNRFLPAPNAGLFSSFGLVPDTVEQADAFIAFRFLGDSIRKGYVPLLVLKEKVDQFANFVKKQLTPPALINGRDHRFFDVQMAEPRFTSLVLAAKKPEFDLASIQASPRLRNVDAQQLLGEAGEQGKIFWDALENATDQIKRSGRLSNDFVNAEKAFLENLEGLIPYTNGELERVEITFNNGIQLQTIFIDRAVGNMIVEAQERSTSNGRTLNGVIMEINGDSNTFIIKDLSERQTTCSIPKETFERLDAQGDLRRGRQVSITGDYTRRKRRDYIWSDNPVLFLN